MKKEKFIADSVSFLTDEFKNLNDNMTKTVSSTCSTDGLLHVLENCNLLVPIPMEN